MTPKKSALDTLEELGFPLDDCDDVFSVEVEALIDVLESGGVPDSMDSRSYPVLNTLDEKQARVLLAVLNSYRGELQYQFESCSFIMERIAAKHGLECPQTEADAILAQVMDRLKATT